MSYRGRDPQKIAKSWMKPLLQKTQGMPHGRGSHLFGTTQGKLAKGDPGMGITVAAEGKRAYNPHAMHRSLSSKVAFSFQSVGRGNKTNPALVPTTRQIDGRNMPL